MINLPKSWQLIGAIEAACDVDSVGKILVGLAKQFGFQSVFGGLIPDPHSPKSSKTVRPLIMVQHLPDGWSTRYNDRGYLFRDPILHRLRSDPTPFSWAESYASCSVLDDVRLVGGEAAEFGLIDGYVIPINTLDQRLAAVSFGGQAASLSPNEATALSFAASFALGHFLRLRSLQRPECASITVREYDCLLWAGEGKTDWEISVILGISRSTVTKHIASAREELGAVNKTHAVAMAMRMKMLQ